VRISFVVTEHPAYLNRQRMRAQENAARSVAAAAGRATEVVHYTDAGSLSATDVVVLGGSDAPWATHDPRQLDRLRASLARCGRPVLGICAGMQLLVQCAGGAIDHSAEPERGFQEIEVVDDHDLFSGMSRAVTVYASHTDEVTRLPDGFRVLATSPRCRVQAVAADERRFWGTQFHPERATTDHPDGLRVLENFFALVRDG
jgi:GMP synthase (glutamine-hydrolysing) A subunit